ncbi:NAD(P)-dependent oxidoreductase [Moritella sp. 28]|uniref:NAD-dependent epimerase/dehydratase family protein n=1 Tax=Moritella sp. 28 TaxID=2746232 RepID=UPI001BA89872|nr:SDR family oxidoreductase [Moritella sp. 28]QUM83585.1 SDR family oxidoreductase [Moritella sp. 28]
MSLYTVFGGKGFIGSEFVHQLKNKGHEVCLPERGDESIFEKNLGIVIYCAGYGDCQKNPFNVLNANTLLLSELLRKSTFKKMVYISSSRVYMNQNGSKESDDLTVCSNDNRRLFNLTKLVSEEMCLKSQRDCLIIRPSNVYGLALNSPLFLPAITRNAINNGVVDMYVNRDYSKDYISVHDLVNTTLSLIDINEKNTTIINLASGENVSAEQIAKVLIEETGCSVNWHIVNNNEKFPITNIDEVKSKFNFKPRSVLLDLRDMIENYKIHLDKTVTQEVN